MPVYTLVITTAAGDQQTTLSDFPDDMTAVADTGVFVGDADPQVRPDRAYRRRRNPVAIHEFGPPSSWISVPYVIRPNHQGSRSGRAARGNCEF